MRKIFLFMAMLWSTVLFAQVNGILRIPTVDYATITIYRNGIILNDGAPVSTGDNLQINYSPDDGYYIDGRVSDNVILTDEMFETIGEDLCYVVPEPVVKEAKPLVPRVRISESGSAVIRWSSYGDMYESYRIVVSAEELEGNPEYWKGMKYLTDTFYIATGLVDGQQYHVYLQGARYGKLFDWVHTTFVGGEYNACQLTIEMHSTNNNWGGDLGFYIKEGSKSTLFTLRNGTYTGSGTVETATYTPRGIIQIVGHNDWGGCHSNNWFVIYDQDGNEVLKVDKEDFCDLITSNAVMYEGRVCPLECQATISNLAAVVDGANFNITWQADGADRFEVAVMRKPEPTDEELEAAAVVVDETQYTFTGVQYAGYKVYVRPICSDGHKGEWESILAYGVMTVSPETFEAAAKPVTLDYVHSGNILEDGCIGTSPDGINYFPALLYSLDLADSTDVGILFRSRELTEISYVVFQLVEGAVKPLNGGNAGYTGGVDYLWNDTVRVAGKVYILVSSQDGKMGNYTMNIYGIRDLEPKEIALGFSESGDFTDGVFWHISATRIAQAKAYSFIPQETVNVSLRITSLDYTSINDPVRYVVYCNGDSIIDRGTAGKETVNFSCGKDTTYTLVLYPSTYGTIDTRYTISLSESKNLGNVITSTPKVIPSLDYVDTWDFADAEEFTTWGSYPTLVRVYSFTPEEDLDVLLWLESPDYDSDNYSLNYALYKTAIIEDDDDYYMDYQNCGYSMNATLTAGTTYYIVLYNYLDDGGEASHHYTFKMYDNTHPQPIPTTLITPDAYIEDTVGDFIPTLGERATIYEYVVTEDKKIAFSLEALNQKEYNMYLQAAIYKDELSISSYNSTYADNPHYTTAELEGSPSGTHYYFVVSDEEPTPYRFILREEPDYDHVPVKGELEIGQAHRSALSVKDGFVFHYSECDFLWNGPYEAYEAMLLGGKEYRVMMHKLSVVSESTPYDNVGIMGTVFTNNQFGSYDDNKESNECMRDEDWVVLEPSAMNDKKTFMFEATLESKNYEDSVVYEFSVEEVKSFENFMADVAQRETEILPFEESDVFSSNVKVYDENSLGFHNDPQSYIEQYGAYDALARRVKIGGGETVFVEFGGVADAVIQFYDPNTLTLLETFDATPYAYPYEKGYFTNEGTEEMEVVVVCSFNKVQIADAAWGLKMSTSEMDLDDAYATPKADQESITLYESDGIVEALDALSQINLMAVNEDESIICTIPNNRFGWDVDLANNVASFEMNNQDLPIGYVFEDVIVFVEVVIERIPDPVDPTGFFDGIQESEIRIQKILRDGQVYIIRDGVVYNIMGQRVR